MYGINDFYHFHREKDALPVLQECPNTMFKKSVLWPYIFCAMLSMFSSVSPLDCLFFLFRNLMSAGTLQQLDFQPVPLHFIFRALLCFQCCLLSHLWMPCHHRPVKKQQALSNIHLCPAWNKPNVQNSSNIHLYPTWNRPNEKSSRNIHLCPAWSKPN